MSEREVVAKFFDTQVGKPYKRDANIGLLIEKSAKPVTLETIAKAAYLLRDTLLLSLEFEEAWQDERERLENDLRLARLGIERATETRIGFAHRNAFIEKRLREEAQKEHESLVKQLGEKFRSESLERLREVAEKRRIHGLTASEFLQERAASQPKDTRKQYDGFASLPDYLVLPGDVQATKIDATFLRGLVRGDYFLYRRLANRYGMTQISDRQNNQE